MYPRLAGFALGCLGLMQLGSCSPRPAGGSNPGSPTPVAEPAPGTRGGGPIERPPDIESPGGLPAAYGVPVRPDDAPLVPVRDVLEADSLLGRRVRVAGRCTAVDKGQAAGSWTLEQSGSTIEVRGLVPPSCNDSNRADITIFAQVERKSPESRDRLLLRLPD